MVSILSHSVGLGRMCLSLENAQTALQKIHDPDPHSQEALKGIQPAETYTDILVKGISSLYIPKRPRENGVQS